MIHIINRHRSYEQELFLGDVNIQIKKIMMNKNKNTQDVVAEVDGKTFQNMIKANKIFIG